MISEQDLALLLSPVVEIIRNAARIAVLPRFQHLSPDEIREKSPGNLVTDADIEAEDILTHALTELLPDSLVLGEEGAVENPDTLDHSYSQKAVWIIDPVDGTRNFTNGTPCFGMIVALMIAGKVRAGWLYYPTDDEMIYGCRQSGVILEDAHDKKLLPCFSNEPDNTDIFQQAFLLSPYGQKNAQKKALQKAAVSFRETLGYGCAAQEYRLLLKGGANLGFYSGIWPWDHAAGSFLLELCGGLSITNDSTPYSAANQRPDWLVIGQNPVLVRSLFQWSQKTINQL